MTRALVLLLLVVGAPGLTPKLAPQTSTLPPVIAKVIGEWRASNGAAMSAVSVAGDHAIYSEYTHQDYEAIALWTYDAPTNTVRMLEANSNGMVMLHVGEIESAESLTLLCYSNEDPDLLVKAVTLRWEGDVLESGVVFFKEGEPTVPSQLQFRRVGK
jgi:hypothetical protein